MAQAVTDDFPPAGDVFNFGVEHVTYAVLVLAGELDGQWQAFLAGCARAAARAARTAVDPEELRAEAHAFRRTRGLEAGDDLRAWLGARGLTLDDWQGALERLIV